MAVVLVIVLAMTLGGFLGPFVTGGTYHKAKWRLIGPIALVAFIWILLTPNGCAPL